MTCTTAIGVCIKAPSQAVAMQMVATIDWAQLAQAMTAMLGRELIANEVLLMRIEVPACTPSA